MTAKRDSGSICARLPFGRRALSALCSLLLACSLALSCAGAGPAWAGVRKADVVAGETVESRGLATTDCPSIDATYAYVVDSDGTVYFERDADTQTHIASVTKIMTAIVALDNASLDTLVTVSNEAATVGESSASLKEGDVLTLKDALAALLTSSGNDAAIAIADTVGASLATSGTGAQAAFVQAMNDKAAKLGCDNTLFANAHGLDFDKYAGDMHSTARDVATMAAYAMRNDTFRSIVAKDKATIQVTRADGTVASIELESTDELIGVYEGACGIKTGFTSLAGECFAGACNRGGKDLYAIVLNSSSEQQRFTDATTLFDWVYNHSVSYAYAHASETTTMEWAGSSREVPVVASVALADWTDKTVKATFADPDGAIDAFSLNGNISCTMTFEPPSGAVKQGDKVGYAVFRQHNEVLATVDLISCEDVDAPNPIEAIGIGFGRFIANFTGAQTVANSVDLNDTPLINDKTKSAA